MNESERSREREKETIIKAEERNEGWIKASELMSDEKLTDGRLCLCTRLCLREGMRWQCGEAPQRTTAHQMFETQGAQSTPLTVETTAPVPNLHSKSNHIQIPRHTNTLELYTLACDFEFCVFSFSIIFVSAHTHNIMAVSFPTIC